MREWVRQRLSSAEVPLDVQDVAELLVSEVATNAIVHADGDSITVELSGGGELEAAVHDQDEIHVPHARDARDEDMTGRGLALVEALAQSWGTRAAEPGKWVWFRLPLAGSEPATADLTAAMTDVTADVTAAPTAAERVDPPSR